MAESQSGVPNSANSIRVTMNNQSEFTRFGNDTGTDPICSYASDSIPDDINAVKAGITLKGNLLTQTWTKLYSLLGKYEAYLLAHEEGDIVEAERLQTMNLCEIADANEALQMSNDRNSEIVQSQKFMMDLNLKKKSDESQQRLKADTATANSGIRASVSDDCLSDVKAKITSNGSLLIQTWTKLYAFLAKYEACLLAREGEVMIAEAKFQTSDPCKTSSVESVPQKPNIGQSQIFQSQLFMKDQHLKKLREELLQEKMKAKIMLDNHKSDMIRVESEMNELRRQLIERNITIKSLQTKIRQHGKLDQDLRMGASENLSNFNGYPLEDNQMDHEVRVFIDSDELSVNFIVHFFNMLLKYSIDQYIYDAT